MTFTQINYFLCVAKDLSFSQAAASLFITQSTLSRSIAALETEIGAKLLERDYHSVRLTPAGDLLYREMQGIMENINGLIHRVQILGESQSSHFSIGILEGQSVAPKMLFAIRSLSDRFPNLSVDIQRMYHQELLENVRAGVFDVAETIVAEGGETDAQIGCLPLAKLNNYIMARADDPLWNEPFGLENLNGRVLIAPAKFHPGLEVINRRILESGSVPKIRKAPDMETQSLWLEAGMGVYIANEENVVFTSRSFRPLKAALLEELPPLSEVLIWSKNNSSPILELFLSFIRIGETGRP